MINVTQNQQIFLANSGVSFFGKADFSLPEKISLEPPCSLKWMRPDYSLIMGAFSYAVSGYYFAAVIGRYVSIGEDVQIGRGSHPIDWVSTSPVFYQRHEDVVDRQIDAARYYLPKFTGQVPKSTIIGHDVYIGHGAFIKQGINIGTGAIVGACAVVTKDVPPYAVVAGNPAKIIKMRFPDSLVKELLISQWWKYAFWNFSGADPSHPVEFLDFFYREVKGNVEEYSPKLISMTDILEVNG